MAISWGNRKLVSRSERGVRHALKHPLLKQQSVIGRGVYSVILGDDRSVFKLTLDRASYALAQHQSRWQSPALPVIRGLHGIVGEIDCGVPLFLIEMDALQRLKAGSPVRICRPSIGRQMRQSADDDKTPSERLREEGARQPDEVGRALALLADCLES